jgi:hypothetical protein
MEVLKKILGKLTGWHYPQEYLCLAREEYPQPLHAYTVQEDRIRCDITNQHLFVGYCPLILALPGTITRNAVLDICFFQQPQSFNANVVVGSVVASLQAERVHEQEHNGNRIVYYQGVKSRHRFLSSIQQWVIGLQNGLYNRKAGNVYLHQNLYKQVQVAYALPRTVSLITVAGEGGYNLFPTDLHGPLGEAYYLLSLRTAGKACAQVLAAGQVVLTDVEAASYRDVYRLGKNHMQPLKERAAFPFSSEASLLWSLPLPQAAVRYRELQLLDTWQAGIHTIMVMQVIGKQVVAEQASTLAHVHNSYATWRYKKGLESNYLLR